MRLWLYQIRMVLLCNLLRDGVVLLASPRFGSVRPSWHTKRHTKGHTGSPYEEGSVPTRPDAAQPDPEEPVTVFEP